MTMEKKYKISYNENNVQGSVAYILVKEFDLTPNILKAEIEGDGTGKMVLSVKGEPDVIDRGIQRIQDAGYNVIPLCSHITRDDSKCWDCGACVSLCPTHSLRVDPETFEVNLGIETCIACGACVNACSVHALKLVL
ncbi:MAG: 4Fe-4S binding protein [archaeon]|nr:4Fe-4S binding protein [archaeon]